MAHLLEGLVGIASWRAVAFQHGAAEVETAPDAGRESAKRLRARDANLLVRCGEAEAVLHGRHKAYSIAAVHAHEETGFLWTYARDKAVRRWAKGGRAIPSSNIANSTFGGLCAIATDGRPGGQR